MHSWERICGFRTVGKGWCGAWVSDDVRVQVRLPLPAKCPDYGPAVLGRTPIECPAEFRRPPFDALRSQRAWVMALGFCVCRILLKLIELAETRRRCRVGRGVGRFLLMLRRRPFRGSRGVVRLLLDPEPPTGSDTLETGE